MDFKTTDGIIISSANVVKTDIKFKGKDYKSIDVAKAKINNDRHWHIIDKSSQRDFVDFAMKLQNKFMGDLGINSFTCHIPQRISTDNITEDDTYLNNAYDKIKTDPIIYVHAV